MNQNQNNYSFRCTCRCVNLHRCQTQNQYRSRSLQLHRKFWRSCNQRVAWRSNVHQRSMVLLRGKLLLVQGFRSTLVIGNHCCDSINLCSCQLHWQQRGERMRSMFSSVKNFVSKQDNLFCYLSVRVVNLNDHGTTYEVLIGTFTDLSTL